MEMPNDIPVLSYTDNPKNDPIWTMLYGSIAHPDFSHPAFFRHNGNPVSLFNLYCGETVYLIGRGPSLGTVLENKNLKELLMHNSVVRYGMNSASDILDNNVGLWSAVDRMTKFSPTILKNPNIMKFIPMNRFQPHNFDVRQKDCERTVAYKNGKQLVHSCHCPNVIGVQTFLTEQIDKISFGNTFLGTPAVLYGFFNGIKSVLLFSIKVCLLLGFSKIVLIGVDFKMDKEQPYYKTTPGEFNAFHIQHNNKLYKGLSPRLKEVCKLLDENKSVYKAKIVTASPIELMPFIPTVNLKQTLEEDILQKK